MEKVLTCILRSRKSKSAYRGTLVKRVSTSRLRSLKIGISLSSANCNSLFLKSTLFFTCADEKVPTYGVRCLASQAAGLRVRVETIGRRGQL